MRDKSKWLNDRSRPSNRKDGRQSKEYGAWKNMKERCTCDENNRLFKNYGNCDASMNFKSYSYFYDWCQSQAGFHLEDSHLDKDLLVKGNNIYSEDTCLFVPSSINRFLVNKHNFRGKYLIGVHYHKESGKFHARCADGGGKLRYLGSFDDEVDAFYKYKSYKESIAVDLLNKYEGVVDERVLEALSNFRVSIED